ncbi:50S ribosomal protein L32e [Candidatus Woesearchaeota archaeon]|nr:50S ribosomal protein L32e [Candidatus Woesearchaeota archaeon]
MKTENLLELRKKIKKSKPQFVERESKGYARIKPRWRYPRGTSSPIRRRLRGEPRLVTAGYGSPREVRGLHSSGLEKVVVSNAPGLQAIDPKKQGAIISSTVGNKKRLELLRLAVEKKIRVLNVKNAEKLIEKIQSEFAARKHSREDKLKEKGKKHEEKKYKAEDKKKKKEEEKAKAEENKEEKTKTEKKKKKEAIEKSLIKRQ